MPHCSVIEIGWLVFIRKYKNNIGREELGMSLINFLDFAKRFFLNSHQYFFKKSVNYYYYKKIKKEIKTLKCTPLTDNQ